MLIYVFPIFLGSVPVHCFISFSYAAWDAYNLEIVRWYFRIVVSAGIVYLFTLKVINKGIAMVVHGLVILSVLLPLAFILPYQEYDYFEKKKLVEIYFWILIGIGIVIVIILAVLFIRYYIRKQRWQRVIVHIKVTEELPYVFTKEYVR